MQGFEIAVAGGEEPVFTPVLDRLFQVLEGLVATALKRAGGRQSIQNVIGFGHELQRVLKMIDRGCKFPAIKVGDADVVIVVCRTQYGSASFMDFLLAGDYQNFGAFLDFGFFGIFRDQSRKTTDRTLKLFRVHQLNAGLVGMDRAFEVLRTFPGW